MIRTVDLVIAGNDSAALAAAVEFCSAANASSSCCVLAIRDSRATLSPVSPQNCECGSQSGYGDDERRNRLRGRSRSRGGGGHPLYADGTPVRRKRVRVPVTQRFDEIGGTRVVAGARNPCPVPKFSSENTLCIELLNKRRPCRGWGVRDSNQAYRRMVARELFRSNRIPRRSGSGDHCTAMDGDYCAFKSSPSPRLPASVLFSVV